MHFGTDHIERVKERLDRQGTPCSPVKAFERNVQTDSGERTMKARSIHFPPHDNPEGLLQIARHDTPELVFQKRYMHHRNGAIALMEIVVVTEDPAERAVRYEEYTGHPGRLICEGHLMVDLGFSRITVVDPANLEAIIPGYAIPVLPFLAAFSIKTISLQLVRDVLTTGRVPFAEHRGTVIVYPENACGSGIIFIEK
jgi:hypothetical protein